jgi:hypothetical protein
MNYTTLSLKELIHYGELDARTPLERALVAALSEMADVTEERDELQRQVDDSVDRDEVRMKIEDIKMAIEALEDVV